MCILCLYSYLHGILGPGGGILIISTCVTCKFLVVVVSSEGTPFSRQHNLYIEDNYHDNSYYNPHN